MALASESCMLSYRTANFYTDNSLSARDEGGQNRPNPAYRVSEKEIAGLAAAQWTEAGLQPRGSTDVMYTVLCAGREI